MDNLEDLEELKKQISELQSKVTKLENESKKENKKENKRWRAKIHDTYFYINDFGYADGCHETNDGVDNYRYKIRNYFKSEEEAEEYQEVINTYYDLMDLAEELNKGRKIDWNDEDQCKYSFYYKYDCDSFETLFAHSYKNSGQIYCLDEDFLKKAIKKIGEDKLKKLFTYERS